MYFIYNGEINMKAFPVIVDNISAKTFEQAVIQEEGMDLRDYFASKAMQTILDWHKDKHWDIELELKVSKAAYQIADAMIEIRGKRYE